MTNLEATPDGVTDDSVLVGVDIGGTKISALITDRNGNKLAQGAVPAPSSEGGEAMMKVSLELIHDLTQGEHVSAVGVGAAGVVDSAAGTIRAASDTFVDWVGYPIAESLADALNVPVVLENDVNAFLLGEAAGESEDVLGIMLGTGVGGALVLEGELRRGPNGSAGEVGHTSGYGNRTCTCGQKGHLETVASGTSITEIYMEISGKAVRDAQEVEELARAGDLTAIQVYSDAGFAVGTACCVVANILDIPRAIVGGGVSRAWDLLKPGIEKALGVSPPVSGAYLEISPARLGDEAVARGAIEAAKHLLVPASFHVH